MASSGSPYGIGTSAKPGMSKSSKYQVGLVPGQKMGGKAPSAASGKKTKVGSKPGR